MKVLLQRSGSSSVNVSGKVISQINHGLVIFVCMEKGDTESQIGKAVEKVSKLRIFEDEQGKMNRSIVDMEGEALCVSQFTLSWDGKKGNRPSFDKSMPPEDALKFFDIFCEQLSQHVTVKKGSFGDTMNVHIQNRGPVTFFLDF